MNTNSLKVLGLTDNEVKVYLAILENGRCGGSKIKDATGITNSRVYDAIKTLIKMGLIVYEKHPNGRVYKALDPIVIKGLLLDIEKNVNNLLPTLINIQKKEKITTSTAVFEGFNGFKTALFNLVEECPAGETIYVIGFSNQAYKNDKLASILRDVNKISIKKKHKLKMILDNKDNVFYQGRKKEGISEIRFMKKGFRSPASIDIFQDNVYILLWDEEPYVFTIKNNNIAEGFKIYFNFLWNTSKA